MAHDAIILGAAAIALLPLLSLAALKVISLGVDVRASQRGLRILRWINWLGVGVLVSATLSDRNSWLFPLLAACWIGDVGWALAIRWFRWAYPWPIVEGQINSVSRDGSQSEVTYSFELGNESYGGMKMAKAKGTAYVVGERVKIAYDPVNPDESTLVPQTRP